VPESTTGHAQPPPLVPSPAALRREFEALVINDLLGPAGGPDETLPVIAGSKVRDRYLVGMLAPQDTIALDPERTDRAGADSGDTAEEAAADDAVSATRSLFPSSVGLSFAVDGSITQLTVTANWGRYLKETREPELVEPAATEQSDKGAADGTAPATASPHRPSRVWQRYPAGGSVPLDLVDGELGPVSIDDEQRDVVVRGRATRTHGQWLVTLFLVNNQPTPRDNKDEAWLFQPELSITGTDQDAIFIGRHEVLPRNEALAEIDELAELDMTYRNTVEFVVGHGTAVHADVSDTDRSRACLVRTSVVPTYEVARTEPPSVEEFPGLADVELDMEKLSATADADLAGVLLPLAQAYEDWLAGQAARLDDPEARLADHQEAAKASLERAGIAAQRLRDGIAVLAADPDAAEAFRFANRAMWQQRVHSLAGAARRDTEDLSLDDAVARYAAPKHHSWRPFQLAFILLNVPSLTDPTHDERASADALVDLLFFPTGGGKTEAYLGLTAFTFAIRRLQGNVGGFDGSGGVAVLMRYTLRLLTAQQFQRAAALVLACEVARRELVQSDPRWGQTPFRLGLWVGAAMTPNSNKDAAFEIEEARTGGRRAGRSSAVQLLACPWCGLRLDKAADAHSDPDRWRTLLFCSDKFGECPFTDAGSGGEGIPVVTVDEELYRLLPSLVIATADKFAQLPWQGPLHMLFGRVSSQCSRHGYRSVDLDSRTDREERDKHNKTRTLPAAKTDPCEPLRPPDLIIQDELHLISGPLGTLVGLYETVVDELSSWPLHGKVVRPKVIASTATVRRAAEQTHALFQRGLAVFPPPVLDVEDSFFARQRPVTDEVPGRRYVGLCAPGQRLKAVETRVFVTVLAAAKLMFDRYEQAADPWMTAVGYFTALRELAGMRRLIDDDVRARLPKAARRGLGKRNRPYVTELTSRVASSEIPNILDQLAVQHRTEHEDGTPFPVDVLLATNMISVGVDVGRLGLMITVGQPKATAEYIQATSRVGRSDDGPGLVFTLYNWARPRDLSHYETFENYHATFYRHVEALSVTPFAPRALDRGLTALLVALVRHGGVTALPGSTWNPDNGAQVVDVSDSAIAAIVERIARRAAEVASDEDVALQVRNMLKARLDQWAARQQVALQTGAKLAYRGKDGASSELLRLPGTDTWDEWTCPNSLRETEPNINLIIDTWDQSALSGPAFVLGAGTPQDGTVNTSEDDEDSDSPLATTSTEGAA
jgi:hypothetical protein